jgi:hypothetical protein
VLLPQSRRDNGQESPHEPAPAEIPSGWESILVVEDDPAIRSLTSKVLQDRGYSVLEAESGPERVRLAQEYDGPIDLVVTDIVMPDISRRKLAEAVKHAPLGTRAIHVGVHREGRRATGPDRAPRRLRGKTIHSRTTRRYGAEGFGSLGTGLSHGPEAGRKWARSLS